MSRKIRFNKYLHDEYSVNENIEQWHSDVDNSEIFTNDNGINVDEVKNSLEKVADRRVFGEIALTVELDLDTGEISVIEASL